MTEQEAKTKWCPMASLRQNRWTSGNFETYSQFTKCLGSLCMMWRSKYVWDEKTGEGYCGLGGKP
jgi:hypothetical protein